MLIKEHSNLDKVRCPVKAIQFWCDLDSCKLEWSLFQNVIRPPERPMDGQENHLMEGSFQQEFMIFWEQSSILDSWIKTKWGSWVLIRFLRRVLLTLAFNPLIFHERIIIRAFFFNELYHWLWLSFWSEEAIRPYVG